MAKMDELTATGIISYNDIMHLRTPGGIDKKITFEDLLDSLFKGMNNIQLTEFTTFTVPKIAAGGSCEINGKIRTNSSELTITGSTSNNNWYDILLTPSGGTYTASFVARNTGVWSNVKQGLYSGNNRVVACVFRDSSGNFISKNILIVISRTVKIKAEFIWNMEPVPNSEIAVAHGLSNITKMKTVEAMIRNDTGNVMYRVDGYVHGSNLAFRWSGMGSPPETVINTNNVYIYRATGFIGSTEFNSTSIIRGAVIITYEV